MDRSGTYVFAVRPMAILESVAKSLSYWSIGNGDDTMVTLWNPADEAQDFVFTLFFSGGHYAFPLHMEGRVTRTFNGSEIVHSQIPDAEGNRIPPAVQEGSAELTGSQGESQHILVAMDAGTYNVRKATCGLHCITCNGATEFWIDANPFSVAVKKTTQLSFTSQYNTGKQYNLTSLGTWSSTNTKVVTVASGLLDCTTPGTVGTDASYLSEPLYSTGCYSELMEYSLDEGADAGDTGNCIPILTTTYSTLWFLGDGVTSAPSTFIGQLQATITAQYASGGSYDWSISNDELSFSRSESVTETTTSTNQVTVYASVPGQDENDVEVSLTWTDPEGNIEPAAPLAFTVDWPSDLTFLFTGSVSNVAIGSSCTGVPPPSGNVGNYSRYAWQWNSFFNNSPAGLPMNENFLNVTLYPGSNLAPVPNGQQGQAGINTFADTYCFANQTSARPPSMPPQSPLGANSLLIWTATQVYSVGSPSVGVGVEVQYQTDQRWQDHFDVYDTIGCPLCPE